MKNRIISCVLTICIMSTTILFGCASPKAEPENASSNDATAQAESDSQSANEASTSDAPSEAATESESEDTEDDAAKAKYGAIVGNIERSFLSHRYRYLASQRSCPRVIEETEHR